LAQAEETLLNYPEARRYMETAIQLSGRAERKDLKKLALYRDMEKQWRAIGLTPEQLETLGVYLRKKLNSSDNTRTLYWTEQWLRENSIPNIDGVLTAIRDRGGFDDLLVLYNVVARG
jgi:hypothetical protein